MLESDNVKWIELAATVVAQLSALRPCVDMLESAINDRLTSDSLVCCLSVYVCFVVCLHVCLLVYLSIYLSVWLSVCLSVWLSVYV